MAPQTATDEGPLMFIEPSIAVHIPAGWSFKESMTILSPSREANVIFSSESLDRSVSAKEYTLRQYDTLANEFPGFVSLGVESFSIQGLTGEVFRHDFRWQPGDEDDTPTKPVRQIQIYAVRPGRGYTATATTTNDHIDEFGPVLVGILSSLIIREAAADRIVAVESASKSSASGDQMSAARGCPLVRGWSLIKRRPGANVDD